jgi:four helix bundle protein
MHNYKELKIWQKSIDITTDVYRLFSSFPVDEKYGLVAQIKRSAVSIASNIAEGAGRNSNKDFLHFLSIAQGSSYELETQLILSNKLGFINEKSLTEFSERLQDIQKMNRAFQLKLRSINLDK